MCSRGDPVTLYMQLQKALNLVELYNFPFRYIFNILTSADDHAGHEAVTKQVMVAIVFTEVSSTD